MNKTAQKFDYSDISIEGFEGPPLNPLQKKLAEIVTTSDCEFNYAVTLRFDEPNTSPQMAKKHGARFQQLYNEALGKPNWQSRHKEYPRERAAIVAVLDGGGVCTHLHYHMMLSRPEHLSDLAFMKLVRKAWRQAGNEGVWLCEIKPIHSEFGWATYLLNEVTSTSTDALQDELIHVITGKR